MQRCKSAHVDWAIFSDRYGVWFPYVEHEWYEKDPSTVTDLEFTTLLRNFEAELRAYDQICFYYNPGRFHPLYRRLIRETTLRDKVTLITHIDDIANSV